MTDLNKSLLLSGKISAKTIKAMFAEGAAEDRMLLFPLAKSALNIGENFLAYDIAEKITPGNQKESNEKIRIMALALARSGSLKRASEMLGMLPDNDDSEIMGLKSRILKDMAQNAVSPEERRRLFLRAGELSLEVFKKKKQYYNGINAASCLLMADEKETAEKLVREQLLPLCEGEQNKDLWLYATLGECFLILGHFNESKDYYSKSAEIAMRDGQFGNFSSTLKQLRMLAGKIGSEADSFINGMDLPSIAVFSGHMIDRPGRKNPRFPAYAEEQVRNDLAKIIQRKNIQMAFSSCACGGDIIFIEEVLRHGGECYVTPPLPLEKTMTNSVDIIPGANWKGRLEKIRENDNVLMLSPECDEIGDDSDSLVYDFTNQYILGQALLKQKNLHFPICGVAVWNGEKSGLPGGTDSAIALWENNGIEYVTVKPEVCHD